MGDLYHWTFTAMGCPCEIRLTRTPAPETVAQQCEVEARRFESQYSRFLATSLTTRINRAAGVTPVEIDQEALALLQYADACYRTSGGRFDITSGVLRRHWHRTTRATPDPGALAETIALIGWPGVEIDAFENPGKLAGTVYLPKPGMELDFGGVVKEYAADAIAVLARQLGAGGGLVNLGGDITIIGPPAEGDAWPIGITHPTHQDEAIALTPLAAGSLTTSGGYERFIEIDGRRYSHLLDPTTGWPVDNLASVSVVAEHAILAGSISTIALLMPEDEALAWLSESGAPYLAVSTDLQCHGSLA